MRIDPRVIRPMRIYKLLIMLWLLLLVFAGCNRQEKEKEAIRASIRQHVASISGLRMNAMELELTQVTLDGDKADALAEFRPKQAPTSTALQVRYQLEKHDGSWVVLNGHPIGGQMSHPVDSAAPPEQANPPGSLPPGHPPLTPPNPSANQTPATNPHP